MLLINLLIEYFLLLPMAEYTLHQINNQVEHTEELVSKLRGFFKICASSFTGPDGIDDFVDSELLCFLDKSSPGQYFYLLHDGELASSCVVFTRKGYHANTMNLGISLVSTNDKYRKKGLVSKLISWVINHYEGVNNESSEFEIGESITNGSSIEYINNQLPMKIRNNGNVNWTLYSIVDEFYTRFGFKPCRDLEWLAIHQSEIQYEPFILRDDGTELLISSNDSHTITEGKNAFKVINDNKYQNCAPETTTFPSFIKRGQLYIDTHLTNDMNEKSFLYDNCGITIKDNLTNTETSAFICQFFYPGTIVIARVVSDVLDKETFDIHWNRILQFVYTYANNAWNSFPCVKSKNVKSKEIAIIMANNDFQCKSGVITKEEFVDKLTGDNGWHNVQQGIFLPMIRPWRDAVKEEEEVSIADNGFWCVM